MIEEELLDEFAPTEEGKVAIRAVFWMIVEINYASAIATLTGWLQNLVQVS